MKPSSANDSVEPKIGDKMPDGTVYAGISPDTKKAMYTTPADAPLTMMFNQAKEYAAKLNAHGHQDWRVPTGAELNRLLFTNRAAIGGFSFTVSVDTTAPSLLASSYCSASEGSSRWVACGRIFTGGGPSYYHSKVIHSAVRCVR